MNITSTWSTKLWKVWQNIVKDHVMKIRFVLLETVFFFILTCLLSSWRVVSWHHRGFESLSNVDHFISFHSSQLFIVADHQKLILCHFVTFFGMQNNKTWPIMPKSDYNLKWCSSAKFFALVIAFLLGNLLAILVSIHDVECFDVCLTTNISPRMQ